MTFYLTPERVKEYATQDPALWTSRNERIWRHRRLFELKKPPKDRLKPGQIIRLTNDAKLFPLKIAQMLSKRPAFQVPLYDDTLRVSAERIEDWCRWYWEEEDEQFSSGPNANRPLTTALRLVRDGMVVDITTPNLSDPAFPWYSGLPDPTTVFPVYAGDKRIRTTIQYRTTVAELRELVGYLGYDLDLLTQEYREKHDQDQVNITRIYAGNYDDCEFAILADQNVLLIDALGYDPVTISYALARAEETPGEASLESGVGVLDRYEQVGVGIFDLIEEPIRAKNRHYSMLEEQLARETNPPRAVFSDDKDKVKEIDLRPGASMHFWLEDKFQVVNTSPDFAKYSALLQVDQQGLDRVLPGSLFGEGAGADGLHEFYLMGSAGDIPALFARALRGFYQAKYRKCLRMYADYGFAPIEIRHYDRTSGVVLGGQPFSYQDVLAFGPRGPQLLVDYGELTPQNEASRANIAAQLLDRKALDLRTAIEIGVPSPWNQEPEKIINRIFEDLALTHPLMTQINALGAALLSPNPLIRAIAMQLLPGLMAQVQQLAMGAQQANAGPTSEQNPNVPRANRQPTPESVPAEGGVNAGLPETQVNTSPPPGVA